MTKVYLVWDDNWDDIRKIFKKEVDAEKFMKGKDSFYIEEWEVD